MKSILMYFGILAYLGIIAAFGPIGLIVGWIIPVIVSFVRGLFQKRTPSSWYLSHNSSMGDRW